VRPMVPNAVNIILQLNGVTRYRQRAVCHPSPGKVESETMRCLYSVGLIIELNTGSVQDLWHCGIYFDAGVDAQTRH